MNRNLEIGWLMVLALVGMTAAGQGLTLEAESGALTAPFIRTNGCILQVVSTALTNGGRAEYNLEIAKTGTYAVQLLVNAPAASNNTLGLAFDAEPQPDSGAWDVPSTAGFQKFFVGTGNLKIRTGPTYFPLSAGMHRLILRGAGANVQIDRFLIYRRPAPPQKMRLRPD